MEAIIFGCYISLLYKLEKTGAVLLIIAALCFFAIRASGRAISRIEAGLTIAYVALATMTAFFVSTEAGFYRTTQCLVIVGAAAAAARYASQLSTGDQKRFLKAFTTLNIAILIHNIVFHLSHGYVTTWKYLADTKFVFSSITVLLFLWEDELKARSIALWTGCALSCLLIVLESGERKAYMVFVACYLLSRSRWSRIAAIGGIAIVAAALFVVVSPQSNVTRQLRSVFDDSSVDALPTRYFFSVQGIGDHSDIIRAFANRNADQLFHDHPIWGVGATGYTVWAQATYGTLLSSGGLAMNVHGERHRIPAEEGMIGIVVALSFVLTTALFTARFWIVSGGKNAPSSARAPAYLAVFTALYCYSEALDTTMLLLILMTGFVTAGLALKWKEGAALRLDDRAWATLRSARPSRALIRPLRHRRMAPAAIPDDTHPA